MKRYTIEINKTNNSNFRNNNASENLDNLILSNLIKMNPYLGTKFKKNDSTLDAMLAEAGIGTKDDHITIYRNSNLLKGDFDTDFAKAAKFLANYTPKKTTTFTFDKNQIAFFEDEIQIGTTLIPLYMLESPKYYNTFDKKTKNIIINIFISINR